MTENSGSARLEVRIKIGDNIVEFAGDKETVWSSINTFLSRVVGPMDIAAKLSGSQDLENLARLLVDKVVIRDGNVSVLAGGDAKKRILYCLAGAYVGRRLVQLADDMMTPRQIAQATRMGENHVRARLSELWRKGLVDKDENGRYRFNPSSIIYLDVREV